MFLKTFFPETFLIKNTQVNEEIDYRDYHK